MILSNEVVYTPENTQFNLWSPNADEVLLRIYDAGAEGNLLEEVPLARTCSPCQTSTGTDVDVRASEYWQATLTGDYNKKFYTFEIRIGEKWYGETPGIFAKAVGVNGHRGAIIDLEKTNP